MSKHTNIQWCDGTVNPTMGCAGCEIWNEKCHKCYAALLHKMKEQAIAEGRIKGYAPTFEQVTRFPGRVEVAAQWPARVIRADKPWLTGAPRMIFVSDMSDALSKHVLVSIGGKFVPVAPGADFDYLLIEIIKNVTSVEGRRHVWLWLTKLPLKMAEFARWLRDLGIDWPSNLWVGTSITETRFLGRIDHLLGVGDETTTRFLSVEPQVELISLAEGLRCGGIRWVIQGGESGRKPRPQSLPVIQENQNDVARVFDLAWARALAKECRDADVAYFLKQLGSHTTDNGKPVRLRDSHGGDWDEWSPGLAIREVPGVDRKWSRPRSR